jgi:hypothetical protein
MHVNPEAVAGPVGKVFTVAVPGDNRAGRPVHVLQGIANAGFGFRRQMGSRTIEWIF